jgi:hypothetical protein
VVKQYHADNHPIQTTVFQESLDKANQQTTFSGVGAKHQNGVAERAIATNYNKMGKGNAPTCCDSLADSANLELRPFAVRHAIFIWNHL